MLVKTVNLPGITVRAERVHRNNLVYYAMRETGRYRHFLGRRQHVSHEGLTESTAEVALGGLAPVPLLALLKFCEALVHIQAGETLKQDARRPARGSRQVIARNLRWLKRWQARAKGRGNRIIKRNSHITIHVADE